MVMLVRKCVLSCLLFILGGSLSSLSARTLVGQHFVWQYTDTVFQNPYIDQDTCLISKQGVKVHYLHGGFDDGTKFSFYFPMNKKDYQGHFFQVVTPFPSSERLGVGLNGDVDDMASFSVTHGAYFIETNEGGAIDFADPSTQRESSIGAYRANAACADFSRVIAQKFYNTKSRPYGYICGGSGGAYRTAGSMECTEGVWDGAIPFVMGSPNAIPNVFSVRMNALRVLHDKLPQIVDAMEVGGSGDPLKGLNAQERDIWNETCRMGFPKHSWYGFRYMDLHGFVATYGSVCMMDPAYFEHDFWETPGYEGYDGAGGDPSIRANRIQQEGTVIGFYNQKMCEDLHLVPVNDEKDEGNADSATRTIGANNGQARAIVLNTVFPEVHFMVGDLIVKSGKAKGQRLQLHGIHDNIAILATVNAPNIVADIALGDTLVVDNSRALASLYFHRHQMPTPDYYAWDQFRNKEGNPIPPQRPMLIGPLFTQAASGCLPTGNIHGKLILMESLWDRECYPWQGDWYKNMIIKNRGQEFCDQNFRLYFNDRCTHGGVDDATQVVSYMPILQQALLDLAQWVEKGIEPSPSTTYSIVETQVEVPEVATDRGGLQPSVKLSINGQERTEVKIGEETTIHLVAHCPKGTGRIVRAELCTGRPADLTTPGSWGNCSSYSDGIEPVYMDLDLSKAKYSEDGLQMELDVPVKYSDVGTYFPTIRVTSSRNGKTETFAQIQNIGRVRVVVEL